MSPLVPEPYGQLLHQLAVGIEVVDAVLGGRTLAPVRIEIERGVAWQPRRRRDPFAGGARGNDSHWPLIDRHDTGLHALRYVPGLADEVVARLYTWINDRRFVPRRLRIPLPSLQTAEGNPIGHRARRISMLPGAAADVASRSTGIRGRVLRDGAPMRWSRVEMRLEGTDTVVARAHGDDRGEFLLLAPPESATMTDLPNEVAVDVHVAAPANAPTATEGQAEQDALWDLPIETLAAPGTLDDPVARGESLPPGYAIVISRTVTLAYGRITSGAEVGGDFTVP